MRLEITGLLLLTATACSPATRATMGAGIATVGGLVTYGAIDSMLSPPCRRSREVATGAPQAPGSPEVVCEEYGEPEPPDVGVPFAFGGLCAAVLGLFIMATGLESDEEPRTDVPPAPAPSPETLAVLGEAEAVGMAVAQLVFAGVDGGGRSARVLGLDDTQLSLRVSDGRAELWNLRIRTVTHKSWRAVGACYEYANERGWRLTSLSASPGCPR